MIKKSEKILSSMEGDSVFERHVFEILDYLVRDGDHIRTEIYEHIGQNGHTAVNVVDKLISLGLIAETRYGRYNRKLISITEKGVSVHELMTSINDIISGANAPDADRSLDR